jgi:uncharacterized protein YndB with AHSA1/START domain
MRIAIWIVASLFAVVGVVALIGYFLPISHEASRSADFSKPPEAVWALIADPNNYGEWWQGSDVKTTVVESVPPSRLVTRIIGETEFGGTWTLEIAPTTSGSRMTVTERGEIYNVVFRALAKYAFGYTGTMESFLEAAKTKLN